MRADEKDNLILRLTLEFALEIIAYCEKLELQRRYVIANQLLKSGTSIGANVREAQQAESRADFVHKCKIAAKEAAETAYWLLLCQQAPQYPDPAELPSRLLSIQKILSRIIASTHAHQ